MWLWLIAQASPGTGTDPIATYGPFAPVVAGLLYALRLLWADNRELRTKLEEQNGKITDRLVPLVVEATRLLGDQEQRQLTPDQVDRLVQLLEELEHQTRRPPARRKAPT